MRCAAPLFRAIRRRANHNAPRSEIVVARTSTVAAPTAVERSRARERDSVRSRRLSTAERRGWSGDISPGQAVPQKGQLSRELSTDFPHCRHGLVKVTWHLPSSMSPGGRVNLGRREPSILPAGSVSAPPPVLRDCAARCAGCAVPEHPATSSRIFPIRRGGTLTDRSTERSEIARRGRTVENSPSARGFAAVSSRSDRLLLGMRRTLWRDSFHPPEWISRGVARPTVHPRVRPGLKFGLP